MRVHRVRGLGKSQELRILVPQNSVLGVFRLGERVVPEIEQRTLLNSGLPGLGKSQIMELGKRSGAPGFGQEEVQDAWLSESWVGTHLLL